MGEEQRIYECETCKTVAPIIVHPKYGKRPITTGHRLRDTRRSVDMCLGTFVLCRREVQAAWLVGGAEAVRAMYGPAWLVLPDYRVAK